MTKTLRIAETALADAVEKAGARYPREVVGFFAGPDPWTATSFSELTNRSADNFGFDVEPRSQFEAEQAIANAGLERTAIVHSHPHGGTSLSELDIRFATRRSELQVVLAVAPGQPVRLAAHMVDPRGTVTPVAVAVLPAATER